MYDDLSRIERCYGCAAEYYRSKEEDEAYEFEKQAKTDEYCRKNKAKLEENKDIAVYFSYDCIGCEHYEEVGATMWNDAWMDIDDVEHGLCHNCNRKECKIWKEMKED